MAIEIERKFRLANDSWRERVLQSTLLRQGYIANTRRASVRLRLAGEAGWLSVKVICRRAQNQEVALAV